MVKTKQPVRMKSGLEKWYDYSPSLTVLYILSLLVGIISLFSGSYEIVLISIVVAIAVAFYISRNAELSLLTQQTKGEIDKNNKKREYKRKCNRCGKVWYSSVNKEASLATGGFLNALVSTGTALTDLGASTQASRNADAKSSEFDSLRKCPNCGSTNYTEKIISFKDKK